MSAARARPPQSVALLLALCLVFGVDQAAAQPAQCALPGNDGDGTVSGVVNTYYTGTGTLNAGATQLTLGTRNEDGAATDILAGDLLLVIQMQDGNIVASNDANYGSGTGSGMGTSNAGASGLNEFVRATSAGGAGATIQFTPALTNTYVAAPAVADVRGRRSYQVIRVPQYSSVTVAGVVAPHWNGSSGGVVAVDSSGVLTLGSGTVEGIADRAVFVAGRGFRGAAGVQGGLDSRDLHWRHADGTITSGIAHGGKGEGIAGTPRYLSRKVNAFGLAVTETSHLLRVDTGVQGYPFGDRARGAPGNAGGGGTDGTAVSASSGANTRNAGGGGGGNYATGGLGGRPWNAPENDTNGRGGAGYAGLLSFSRVILGGGGGSGGTNDGTDDAGWHANAGIACGVTSGSGGGTAYQQGICSSGGAGGGIVILRARSIAGTGVIDVRGAPGYNVRNDAAGGGGAGGTVVLHTIEGGSANVLASGGDGGNAWASNTSGLAGRHGPGGGGGGGFVAYSPAGMSLVADVTGGTPGVSSNGPFDTYGAFGHNGGITTFLTPDTPGIVPGASCQPDLRLAKSNGIDVLLTSGTTTYTLTVSNVATVPTVGAITVVDVLPPQLSVADGAVPLGGPQAAAWSCSASANVLTCQSGTVLPPGGTSAFSFTALVSSSDGQAIINRARVGGGGDPGKPVPTPASAAACTGNNIGPGCAIDVDVVNAPFLNLTKSNAGTLLYGGIGSYTLTVTNIGSAVTAGTVYVVDVLPAGLSFDSGFTTTGGFSCSHAAGVVSCQSGAPLAVGASATIAFTVAVAEDAPSAVTNRAIVGGGGDPAKPGQPTAANAANCPAPAPPASSTGNNLSGCSSVTDPVRRVQLTLEKTDYQNVMTINGQTTYHFIVRNTGDAASVGTIYFRDVLPSPMTWSNPLVKGGANGASWTCVRTSDSDAECQSTVSIAAGGSSTFSLVADVNDASSEDTQYVNRGRIGGGGDPDLLPGAPTSSEVGAGCTANNVAPGCALDINVARDNIVRIRLEKSHLDPQSASPGDVITFSLVVRNTGDLDSAGLIRLVDVIPPGLSFAGTSPFSSGGFDCVHTAAAGANPAYLTCERMTPLPAGGSTTISYPAAVDTGASDPIVNRAEVGGGGDTTLPPVDSITPASAALCSGIQLPAPGCAIDPVPLNTDLAVTKTNSVGYLVPGATTTYTIVVTNHGPGLGHGAVLTDIPSAGLVPTGITCTGATAGAACPAAPALSLANLLGPGVVLSVLPPGGTITFEVTADVVATGSTP